MTQTEIFNFFFPNAVCARVRRGQFDVLENLHVKHKADAAEAKDEPAPGVAKTAAVQFDLWGRDRPDRAS